MNPIPQALKPTQANKDLAKAFHELLRLSYFHKEDEQSHREDIEQRVICALEQGADPNKPIKKPPKNMDKPKELLFADFALHR